MAVTGIGGASALTLQSISDMRNKLDDLQRQLGSGQKTTTYAGLGLDAGLTVGLRTQLNAVAGYQSTITQVGVRLDLMQTALSQFSAVSQQSKSSIVQSQYQLAGGTQTQDQKNTANIAQFSRWHAQHGRGRALLVLRPHRRSRAGRQHGSDSQRQRRSGGPQASHRRTQAGRSRQRRPRPAGRRWGFDADLGFTDRRCVAVRLQARRRDHGHFGSNSNPAGRCARDNGGRSRRNQSEPRRYRSSSALRCRTAAIRT